MYRGTLTQLLRRLQNPFSKLLTSTIAHLRTTMVHRRIADLLHNHQMHLREKSHCFRTDGISIRRYVLEARFFEAFR